MQHYGSEPKDPRRNEPQKKAIKYRITVRHLEELIDVLIADYNATPHEGVNFATHLDAMKQRILRFTINQMQEEQRNEIAFLSLKASREIKGDIRAGRRLFVLYGLHSFYLPLPIARATNYDIGAIYFTD